MGSGVKGGVGWSEQEDSAGAAPGGECAPSKRTKWLIVECKISVFLQNMWRSMKRLWLREQGKIMKSVESILLWKYSLEIIINT